MTRHLQSYLSDPSDVQNVVMYYQQQLAELIHAQMQAHRWEKSSGYDVTVTRGFMALKESAYTAYAEHPVQDFHVPPADKSKIAQIVFGGFSRCLYPVQKFQSDTERKLAVILERDAEKWFKPALGQFQIYYTAGFEQKEYQPDFVAETASHIYLLEPKASGDVDNPIVQAKRQAAQTWCERATAHAREYGGKPWKYAVIPHDAIAENMSLKVLVTQYSSYS
jgi:type III restriction enzyme